ncbi:hypothetical protein PI124_g10707 [Phytophthora idaei]|nr:hypothetical protein PI125_g3442 [Phytophthora idaei]KAG3167806.1 hypothetical protein PI126_g3620 [Phytophthora idaei]KAG3244518.1 hypothetical protein PI124_g10707 [Phytophthora idaei]
MFSPIALSSVVALVALTSLVNGHGYLKEPSPTWDDSPNPEWVVNIDNYWDIGSGGDQCGLFKTMAEEKNVSVKDVVLDMVGAGNECGHTLTDGTRQPIPSDGLAKWLGNGGGGFTHVGPCKIYLDDTMVLHGDNCEDEYPGGDVGSTVTSAMPVDYSSCTEDCTLTIYWLAFQNANWQAYINCVPLTGSGSTTASTSTPEVSETSSSTAAEAETTDAPSMNAPSTETQSTDAEVPVATTVTTQAPSTESPSTEVPTPETKCNAPSRRLRKKTTRTEVSLRSWLR